MTKCVVLLTFLLIFSIKGFSQPNWNLIVSGGLAVNINPVSDGFGINLGAGFQKNVWRDRIRIHPSINYGRFWGGFSSDIPETAFNSMSTRFDVEGDFLRIGPISLLLGTGLMLNTSFGWVETDFNSLEPGKSKFSTTALAFNFLGGFRFVPKKNGKAITEFILLNITFDKWDQDTFSEVTFFQVREIIPLNWGRKN